MVKRQEILAWRKWTNNDACSIKASWPFAVIQQPSSRSHNSGKPPLGLQSKHNSR